jgi:outer membrane putative beta-barrel porin/alpha-amylase
VSLTPVSTSPILGPFLALFGGCDVFWRKVLGNSFSQERLEKRLTLGMSAIYRIRIQGFLEKRWVERLGDIYLQPINLGWHLKQANLMVTNGLYLPTGKYSFGADDNTGLGMWTDEFGAGTIIFFDPEKNGIFQQWGIFKFTRRKKIRIYR